MSLGVSALIVVSVILISNANSENAYSYADQEQLNDTSFLTWKDLRNEVRQGDAVTYELGTPKYEILNADEPIEIITADQPGYYESLRRYEQAAKRPKSQREESTTQTPEKAELLQQVTAQTEAPVSLDDKKVKFIIFQSKKNSNGRKKQLGVLKSKHQEDATLAESRDSNDQRKPKKCKHNKLAEKAKNSKLTTFSSQVDRPALGDQANKNSATSAITESRHQQSKQNETIPQYFATTPKPLQPMRMSQHISTTQPTIIAQTSHTATPDIVQPNSEPITAASIQYKPIPAMPTPIEAPPGSSSMFLADGTEVLDMSSSYRNNYPEGIYAAKVNAKYPYYEAPPHIRDFEYLYRSALGMNEQ